ncbi:MAG: aldo/keto reductase [Bacilli bacterium]|nr:aldo/keto reductase [Bacilli bacterium]
MKVKNIKLNDNNTIPEIGFGVYMINDRDKCKQIVQEAIKLGYRHFDTAQYYKNERAVGDAIRESGIDRSEFFVTTKIWISDYGYDKCKQAVEDSLKRLNIEYIDLVLLHQRYNDYIGAWKALEDAQKEGKIKSIGVSNFRIEELTDLLNNTSIVPVVNQIECHPYYQRKELKEFMDKNNIKTQAWFPLGHGDKKLLNEKIFTELGNKYNKTPAQVILKWHLECNHIVFPKSLNIDHIKENIDLYDFELSKEDMEEIDKLNKERSYLPLPEFLNKAMYCNAEKIFLRKKEDID